jgi:hypothetical protein
MEGEISYALQSFNPRTERRIITRRRKATWIKERETEEHKQTAYIFLYFFWKAIPSPIRYRLISFCLRSILYIAQAYRPMMNSIVNGLSSKFIVAKIVKKFPLFLELYSSLHCSQKPTIQ